MIERITLQNGNVITFVEDRTAPKTEPPKRWRNEYEARRPGAKCSVCGAERSFRIGARFLSHCSIWPSYDIALTKGLEFQPYTDHRFVKPVACDE